MRDYTQALAYLNQFINYERSQPIQYTPETLSLDRMEQLLDRLGHPDRSFPTIHIAGTKGKGSTAALIESVLRAAGYHTGLYTSPHLHTCRERIRVNNHNVSKEDFALLVDTIEPQVTAVKGVTWFEIVTALAFLHFAQTKIDVGVLEVGLGGRFDATNVVTPLVSVITSLSMDHMNLLGDTLEQIAFEKAGIIKPNVPVVSAPQRPEALAVIERICAERRSPLTLVGRDVAFGKVTGSLEGQEFTLRAADGNQISAFYRIPLLGTHQVTNAATAVTALNLAATHALPISDEAIRRGLANVHWPGRLEILSRDPLLVVDGAHNADSAQKLAAALPEIFGDQAWILVIGISADKDIPAILDALIPIAARILVTRAHNSRAADVETLAQQVKARGIKPVIAPSVAEAVEAALQDRAPIVVTGSLFTVADAREAWARRSGSEVQEKDD